VNSAPKSTFAVRKVDIEDSQVAQTVARFIPMSPRLNGARDGLVGGPLEAVVLEQLLVVLGREGLDGDGGELGERRWKESRTR
jgi:hypothetical protein